MPANNKLYDTYTWISGLFLGMAWFVAMKIGTISSLTDIRFLILFGIGVTIPFMTIGYKLRLISNGAKTLFALKRTTRHIIGDYCITGGSVSLFSMLTYFILQNKSILIDQTMQLSFEAIIIFLNILLVFLGTRLLSKPAEDERNEQASPSTIAPIGSP